ncbi:NUDIX hydrolase [Knoellia sp. CPCC 206453]|uniref:NUDIX hydrolase n=1 Tax=Knoellia pratensis TaxID=3404796 RepID=UPI00360C1B04
MAVLLGSDGTRHAVARLEPSRENPEGYHRLVGGGVEFGETSLEAVVREVREELGATLIDPSLLGVLENHFELDGDPGHEVVFVYCGRLDPADRVPPQGGMFADNDQPMPVEWRPIDDASVRIPLYPSGAGALVRQAAAHLRAD